MARRRRRNTEREAVAATEEITYFVDQIGGIVYQSRKANNENAIASEREVIARA